MANTPLLVNRSIRGVPVPANRLMNRWKVAVAPVLLKQACSTGGCVPVCGWPWATVTVLAGLVRKMSKSVFECRHWSQRMKTQPVWPPPITTSLA